MKKYTILLAMIALLALTVSAVTVSNPTIGNDRQDRVANVTGTFTITNNDTATLSGIVVTPSADAKYALTFTDVPTSLAAGSSATVTVRGKIPLDHAGIDDKFNAIALKIGTFTVSGTVNATPKSATGDVLMQAANQFDIDKVRIDCGDKAQSIDDGEKVDKLKPGMDCQLQVTIENLFDEDDTNGQRIGDVEFSSLTIDIDSDDSDVDVDLDDEPDDLGADEKDDFTADIEIDEEANDGTVKITIEIVARDENGARHGEMLTFRLDIERLTHDVQIRNIDLSPTRVNACIASNVRVTTSILNQGKRDEDNAAVEVKVPDLNFQKKVADIELDEDDSTSASIDIAVPANTLPGIYRVNINTYFDGVAPSQSGSAEFVVEKCDDEPVEVVKTEPKTDSTVQPTTTVVVPQSNQVQAQAAPKKSGSSLDDYTAVLAVMIVIVLGLIVAGAVFLSKRK